MEAPFGMALQQATGITGSRIGGAPVLPVLPSQIPIGEEIGALTAEGARDAHAVIPPPQGT